VRTALVTLVLLARVAAGWGAEPAEEGMIRVIMDQLQAFRRGDFAAAYAHASSGIQARFALAAFQQMVTGGYPAIARSARAEVRDAEETAPGHGMVVLRIAGQDGDVVDALYEMIEEDGAWRIAGVVTRPVTEPGRTTGLPPGGSRPAA
jgi:phage-related baseplate assembly protein